MQSVNLCCRKTIKKVPIKKGHSANVVAINSMYIKTTFEKQFLPAMMVKMC